MESAQGILSVMSQAGLELGADTYTTLLCGYARAGDIETISRIIEECESKEVYLLDKDYLDVVYALITNGHEQHAQVVLNKIRKTFGYNQVRMNTNCEKPHVVMYFLGRNEHNISVNQSWLRRCSNHSVEDNDSGF